MKIKDCPYWPCDEFTEQGHIPGYDYINRGDIRKVHAWHQIEAFYVSETWDHMVVGTNGFPYRQLIHKGRKP